MTEVTDTPIADGAVRVFDHGGVRLHLYTAPEHGLLATTPILEGPARLVIFDGQFFLPYAEQAANYVASLGKPVARIVLSHIHLDHWGGLGVMARRFPAARLAAAAGVGDYLRRHGQRILDARRAAFGSLIPAHPTIPDEVLAEGRVETDGIEIAIRRYEDAESAIQMVAVLPALGTLLAFDLAFAPDAHVFTVTPHFANWMRILDELAALPGIDRVISGHGAPARPDCLAATAAHLDVARRVHAGTRDPRTYARRMTAAFPARAHPEWIELSSELLYSVVDAYDTQAPGAADPPECLAGACLPRGRALPPARGPRPAPSSRLARLPSSRRVRANPPLPRLPDDPAPPPVPMGPAPPAPRAAGIVHRVGYRLCLRRSPVHHCLPNPGPTRDCPELADSATLGSQVISDGENFRE